MIIETINSQDFISANHTSYVEIDIINKNPIPCYNSHNYDKDVTGSGIGVKRKL